MPSENNSLSFPSPTFPFQVVRHTKKTRNITWKAQDITFMQLSLQPRCPPSGGIYLSLSLTFFLFQLFPRLGVPVTERPIGSREWARLSFFTWATRKCNSCLQSSPFWTSLRTTFRLQISVGLKFNAFFAPPHHQPRPWQPCDQFVRFPFQFLDITWLQPLHN